MKRLLQLLAAIVLLGAVAAPASACRLTSALSSFVYSLSDDCRKGDALVVRASSNEFLRALAARLCDADKATTFNEHVDISHPPELRCTYLGYDKDKGRKLLGYELVVPQATAVRSSDPAPRMETAPSAPAPAVQPAPNAPSSSDSSALQARKDLTAIGLSYSSQQQFVDAVRRNDTLAVQLYLRGDAIDVNAADARGETPLLVAATLGTRGAAMVKLLRAAGAK
jgi:hypothetical protein